MEEVICSLAPVASTDSPRSHKFPQVSHCHLSPPPSPFLQQRVDEEKVKWLVWFLLGGGFWGVLLVFFARSFSA